ncbi:glycosyltransferase family 2 protein [Falsiroseomonas sp. HW251]|uniref:glycosyltransferase family 2 protein n=1 Tax=Falsiroseomonas sp. HW251 TaxID=3390998 RepID=UPI003D31AC47
MRRDERPVPDAASEIRLFGVLRDEKLRLPYFLDYYRKLGVTRFLLIDNMSRDGSGEFLLQQPDCHVFFTEGSYLQSRAGVTWLNSLLDTFGLSHWIVLADIDELLVYPDCEQADLPRFCAWLDRAGHEAMYALLLDMYSKQPMRDLRYEQGEDFRQACPYHDGTYYLVRRFGFPNPGSAFPPFEHIGGPRLRLCFAEQLTPALWPRLRPKVERRALAVAHMLGLLRGRQPPNVATQAFKVPLVKWKAGNAFVTSHRLNPVKLAPVTGALLHFKYFQDFSRRIEDALESGEHYGGSVEYRRYAELLAADPTLSLADAGSVAYASSQGLVERGLIRTSPDWAPEVGAGTRKA